MHIRSLFPFNVRLDGVPPTEILKPYGHMYTVVNGNLTVVDLKQNKS